jgi:hypothetical protein
MNSLLDIFLSHRLEELEYPFTDICGNEGVATEVTHAAREFGRNLPAVSGPTRILALIKANINMSAGEGFPSGVPDGEV